MRSIRTVVVCISSTQRRGGGEFFSLEIIAMQTGFKISLYRHCHHHPDQHHHHHDHPDHHHPVHHGQVREVRSASSAQHASTLAISQGNQLFLVRNSNLAIYNMTRELILVRGEIFPCRHCRRQCNIFASRVNVSIFTHFCVFLSLKLLKLIEIDGVKFLAWKSGGVKFWTNLMSDFGEQLLIRYTFLWWSIT